jgi:hypothetical protein
MEAYGRTGNCIQVFITPLFVIVRAGNTPDVYQRVNG